MHKAIARPGRILVVEDDGLQRDVLCATLAWLGYAAEAVSSGLDALARIACGAFDLLLIDRHMPGLDGIETARRVRDLPGVSAPPSLIALTAAPDGLNASRTREVLFDAVIGKPFSMADLTAGIDQVLAARARQSAVCHQRHRAGSHAG